MNFIYIFCIFRNFFFIKRFFVYIIKCKIIFWFIINRHFVLYRSFFCIFFNNRDIFIRRNFICYFCIRYKFLCFNRSTFFHKNRILITCLWCCIMVYRIFLGDLFFCLTSSFFKIRNF